MTDALYRFLSASSGRGYLQTDLPFIIDPFHELRKYSFREVRMNAISEKLSRTLQLFKRSVRVIQEHPKLLVFPLVTGFLTTIIALFFLAPVGLLLLAPHLGVGGQIRALTDSIAFVHVGRAGNFNFQLQPLGSAILAGVYLVNMFLATMASVAFNHEIIEALNNRPVSIGRGLAAACARWKSVLLWSLVAGVVGLIIRALEERLSLIGRLVAGLIGLAWSAASIFAIPILAREPGLSNPFAVLSKSAETIKRTWGETLAGYVGMQGTNLLVLWFSLLLWAAAGAAAIVLSNAWILLIVGVPWLFAVVVYGYLAGIASRVYLCALYLYAADGFIPGQYDASMMSMGWKMKKSRRLKLTGD